MGRAERGDGESRSVSLSNRELRLRRLGKPDLAERGDALPGRMGRAERGDGESRSVSLSNRELRLRRLGKPDCAERGDALMGAWGELNGVTGNPGR